MLPPKIETEIALLATRHGEPRRVSVALSGAPFDPLIMTDRFGEVCMVIRRPGGTLLTAIKTFYPPGAYRLLTGGVGHGEPIEAGLLREVDEETGLEVAVRRFLSVIEYHLDTEQITNNTEQKHTQYGYDFVTFVFLLDEVGGMLSPRDPGERIGAFREVEVAELPALAATLDSINVAFDPQLGGSGSDWGRVRAVVHRVGYDLLG